MSLSDCPDCWDTPCTCGHEYQGWSIQRLTEHIQMLQDVLRKKQDTRGNSTATVVGNGYDKPIKEY